MACMRPILFCLVPLAPIASVALAQPAEPSDPHQDQVPDLQLVPPPGGQVPPKGPPDGAGVPGQPQEQAPRPGAGRPPPKPHETDDQLLAKLAKAPDNQTARPIERELKARCAHTGSPSADLLLKRVDQAMEAHDFDTAREIVQKLTVIAPNFAEAWHRRATLATQKDDYEDAITSLRRTLALQPKNFVALAELGSILEEYNDKPHALDAYRQAKTIDPRIDGIEDRIKELTKAVEGQGI